MMRSFPFDGSNHLFPGHSTADLEFQKLHIASLTRLEMPFAPHYISSLSRVKYGARKSSNEPLTHDNSNKIRTQLRIQTDRISFY